MTTVQNLLEWLENNSDVQSHILNWNTVKENAIAFEKEQIIEAHTHAYLIGEDNISLQDAKEAGEKYYNERYIPK